MVIKVLISGLSASKEIKKHQQRAQMLLDSLKIKYETIDITEPGHEEEKELMKTVCKKRNNNSIALPPQFFNDDQYCGDFEDFSLASDDDTVLSFLKLEEDITIENGDVSPAPEGMSEQIDNNSIVNGETEVKEGLNNGETNEDLITDEDVVTVVEEKLTLNGQVIDIPEDKIIEVKGKKIDLNEMLFTKTKKVDEFKTIISPKSEPKDELNESPMDVELEESKELDNNSPVVQEKTKKEEDEEEGTEDSQEDSDENED